jgi:hypothetical protein
MSNRGANEEFLTRVLVYLHLSGFTRARHRDPLRGASLLEKTESDVGDVVGLPLTIAVRNQRDLVLSEALNEVAREAKNAGNDLYASIQSRRGHDIGESYATMPLRVLCDLIARLYPEEVWARPDLADARKDA